MRSLIANFNFFLSGSVSEVTLTLQIQFHNNTVEGFRRYRFNHRVTVFFSIHLNLIHRGLWIENNGNNDPDQHDGK